LIPKYFTLPFNEKTIYFDIHFYQQYSIHVQNYLCQ